MAYINQIYEWEGDSTQPYGANYTWKSKKFLLPVRNTFGAARVIAEYQDREDYWAMVVRYNAAIASNNALISSGRIGGLIGENDIGALSVGGDSIQTQFETTDGTLRDISSGVSDYSGDFNCSLKVYADGTLKQTRQVYADKVFRIAGGYRARVWEFQIEGNVIVKRIDIAGSVEELKGIATQQEGES